MQGLELSYNYYNDIIKPFINDRFPELSDRIAVGLVGEGSDCFGYDDDLSKDHDWGTKICLWLSSEDYLKYGIKMAEQLNMLPKEYMNTPVLWIPGKTGVMETSSFFRKYLKKGTSPETVGEWLSIPEEWLAVASNGRVFQDPLGEFSSVWKDLRMGYPEDIRLKKIAYHCMLIGQSGQYNYPRLIQREEYVAAELAICEFMREVMAVVYLLNGKYAPFYKWMHRGLHYMSVLGNEIAWQLKLLLTGDDKQGQIEEICELLIMEFHRQEISEEQDFFMVSQGEDIHRHIQMEQLRNTDPWMRTA